MEVMKLKVGDALRIGNDVTLTVDRIFNGSVDFIVQNTGTKIIENEEIIWQHKKASLKASLPLPKIPKFKVPSKKKP